MLIRFQTYIDAQTFFTVEIYNRIQVKFWETVRAVFKKSGIFFSFSPRFVDIVLLPWKNEKSVALFFSLFLISSLKRSFFDKSFQLWEGSAQVRAIFFQVALGYAGPSLAFVIPHIFIKTIKIHKELMKTKLLRKFPTRSFDGARA